MHTIGFDIGTTTLSAVVVNSGDGTVLHAVTVPSEPFLSGFAPYARVQDATAILDAYAAVYDPSMDKQQWFAAIKELCPALGFCSEVKEYKKIPAAIRDMPAT